VHASWQILSVGGPNGGFQLSVWDYELFNLFGACVTPPDVGENGQSQSQPSSRNRNSTAQAPNHTSSASAVNVRSSSGGGDEGGGVFALTAGKFTENGDGSGLEATSSNKRDGLHSGGGGGGGISGSSSTSPSPSPPPPPSAPKKRATPTKVVFLDPYPLLAAACDDRTVRVRLGSPFFFLNKSSLLSWCL